MRRIFDVLQKIDAGGRVPRLEGPQGAFFRRYAAERGTAVRLALEAGVDIRRDGKLSGAPIGAITIKRVSAAVGPSVSRTYWGEVERHLVLCPQLLTIVVLRIWMTSASGREAVRSLLTAEEGECVWGAGDFRWSPPGAITTGRADFKPAPGDPLADWTSAPYIKATADDLMVPAHPLDLRDVYLEGRPRLVQFRCVLLRPLGGDRALVVGGFRGRPVELRLESAREQAVAGDCEAQDHAALALLLRDAWSESWETLAIAPVDSKRALEHIVSWCTFMRLLDPGFGSGQDPEEAGRRALRAAGVPPPEEPPEIPALCVPDIPIVRLALALNRRIRIRGALARHDPRSGAGTMK